MGKTPVTKTCLVCWVNPFLICTLCNNRWCADCYDERVYKPELKKERHYYPVTLYTCPLYKGVDVSIIDSAGEDFHPGSSGPYRIVRYDPNKGLLKRSRHEWSS